MSTSLEEYPLCLLPVAAYSHAAMHPLSRTTQLIEAGISAGQHIGAQLAIYHHHALIADYATGLARPAVAEIGQNALPMTPDSLVIWMSAGKPITAIAIAQLWEKGLLTLDDTIARHIPEFAAHGKQAITMRHILTHMAPLRLVDLRWPIETWEQAIARICAARPEPRFIAGKTAGYSMHATWFILGEIIRRLAQLAPDTDDPTGLASYYRRQIFLPASMIDTHAALSPAQQAHYADRLAIMQITEKHPAPPFPQGFDTPQAMQQIRPSASNRGPIRELALFYESLARTLSGLSTQHPALLSPQAIEALTARHRVHILDKTFNAIIDWGLGFIINSATYNNPLTPYQYGPHAGTRTFGHSGNQSSTAFHDPENELTVALVFNGMPGESQHQARTREVLAAIYEDLELAPH